MGCVEDKNEFKRLIGIVPRETTITINFSRAPAGSCLDRFAQKEAVGRDACLKAWGKIKDFSAPHLHESAKTCEIKSLFLRINRLWWIHESRNEHERGEVTRGKRRGECLVHAFVQLSMKRRRDVGVLR